MTPRLGRGILSIPLAAAWLLGWAYPAPSALAQPPTASPQGPQTPPIGSLDELVRMSREELDRLYQASSPAPLPSGKVKGRVVLFPGTKLARPTSRFSRLLWQGKVIAPDGATATNRFFGIRIIRGALSEGPSWMDGRPSTILDYEKTSTLYADYRDEIRQVGPDLFLGAMYSRATPNPSFVMYFALQTPASRRR